MGGMSFVACAQAHSVAGATIRAAAARPVASRSGRVERMARDRDATIPPLDGSAIDESRPIDAWAFSKAVKRSVSIAFCRIIVAPKVRDEGGRGRQEIARLLRAPNSQDRKR